MKKLSLFMLMAVGLLISTTMSAAPERPVKPTEPKEGIELPEATIPEHPALPEKGLVKKTFNKVAKAPSKAPMGEGNVAKIGTTEYATLQAAFDSAREAGIQTTIEMIDDATESDELYIYGGSDVILNLNGKTITLSAETSNSFNISYSPEDGYEATLNDKLTINGGEGGKIIATGWNIANKGTLIVNNVALENKNAGCVYNEGYAKFTNSSITTPEANDSWAYGIDNEEGVMEITNTNFNCSGDYGIGIYTYSTAENQTATVTGGTINAGYPVYNDGRLSISNATLSGSYLYSTTNAISTSITKCIINALSEIDAGIATLNDCSFSKQVYVSNATCTITDGTLISSNYYTIYNTKGTLNISGNPTIINENDGASIWYASCVYGASGTVNINGGTFMANNMLLFGYGATFNIEGGTFYEAPYYTFYAGNGTKINLKGGKANTNNKGDFAMFVASGYALSKPIEGWYSVIKSDVLLNGVGYPSVADALVDAIDGDALYLLDNISGDVNVTKSVHIYLNDKTITGCLSASNSANVLVHGTATSRVGSFNASAGATIKTDFGTYAFEPESKYLVDGCQAESAGEGLWKITAGEVVSLSINGATPQNYTTLGAAVQAAGNEPSVITFLKDFADAGNVKVEGTQTITIDMNGHKMSNATQPSTSFAMIENKGILTLKDSKDTNKNGTGGGEIGTASLGADMRFSPGYATNVILNCGKLTVESGLLTSYGDGSASYAIDNDAEDGPSHPGYGTTNKKVELYITGGKIVSLGTSAAIRMYLESTDDRDNIIDIQNAIVSSIWVQESNANAKGYLSVKNTIFTESLSASWKNVAKNLSVILDDVIIENSKFSTGIDYSNRIEGDSTLSCNNVRIKSYRLSYPFKHLHNGQFQFRDDVYVCFGKESSMREEYPESKGYYYMPFEGCESYVEVYLSVQSYYRDFVANIEDGYYLRLMDGEDGENKWYEIVPAQGTTGEASGSYGELGNPWHQDRTWDLTKDEVIPQDTTPVHIDHNVYVEEDTKAVAASVQIEAGQILTVKSGATLQILDAGALFKDETAKLVIEPDAVVTVGSNGVIADNVDNIIINTNESEQGVFMCDPAVSLNTQPEATVYLYTKAKQKAGAPKYEYIYQRFAIPTADGAATVYGDDYVNQELFEGGTSYVDAVFGWNTEILDWQMLESWREMKPFIGYQVTNNTKNGGITYSFKGNLVGNHDSNFEFASHPEGFQFFGNSYTAPIYIPTFLDSIEEHDANKNIQYSVWVYDIDGNNFISVTKLQAEYGIAKYKNGQPIKEVRSMQSFILKGDAGSSTELSYEGAIWNNPRFNDRIDKAPRNEFDLNMDVATIIVEAENGQADQVTLLQSNDFSEEFENGADASKFIYAEGINLYANANFGKLSNVATDELEGTILAFKSGKSSQYTIHFDNLNGEMFTLVDMVTGAQVAMMEGNEYSFTQAPNTDNEVRFMVMGEYKAPTGNENIKTNKITKVVENGQFYIVKDGVRYNTVGASFDKQ